MWLSLDELESKNFPSHHRNIILNIIFKPIEIYFFFVHKSKTFFFFIFLARSRIAIKQFSKNPVPSGSFKIYIQSLEKETKKKMAFQLNCPSLKHSQANNSISINTYFLTKIRKHLFKKYI